jgi:hypothetical protein
MVAGAVRDELGVVPFVARERERERESFWLSYVLDVRHFSFVHLSFATLSLSA